ncbi:TPA: DUF1433 domain-containing protein, partial [Bacillus cereus]
MKKKLVITLSIICIIAGGYFTMEYLKQKEKKEIFWKAQEARVTKYIHYNVKNVKSITFTKQDVSPM